MSYQSGIIDEIPSLARYQYFNLKDECNPKSVLQALANIAIENDIVVGFGETLISALDVKISNMRKMPEFKAEGYDKDITKVLEIPTTPYDLWCWIRGEDRGDLLHKARLVRNTLASAFEVAHVTDAFKYDKSRDLTGYEDGTENPTYENALEAALLKSNQTGLNDSSFVAVQHWVHDLDTFEAMTTLQQDHSIGRDRISNEELDDAPESAHVKRTEQEGFEPEAFVVRRSMPWANEIEEGLVFVAFGKSFDAFEAQMRRMIGNDDGIIDGLFSFTRPITGSYFWCPPVINGKLDLSAIIDA
ncbi:MAG: putative iron-dependent peroxidase [Cocleimonas sp.]|jgi:putative iron-dependent peroxidase